MPKHQSKIEKLIAGIVGRQNELRKAIDEIVADLERGNLSEFPTGLTEGKYERHQ